MSIGFHTGVLEDRTLDIARAHDQVMTDLLSHGLEKKEQREKEFMELMSVDFVNGLNTRVKEKQQGWIDDFNAAGTQVLKNAHNKWGNVSVDERVKIQNRMQELEQKQESLRQSVAVFDKARETIANPNMANHFDLDESAERIKKEFNEWDGESLVSAENMLVPAYANMLDEFQTELKNMDWSTATERKHALVGGVRTEWSEKTSARGGMFNPSDRIQFLEDFVQRGDISRAADRFLVSEELTAKSQEAVTRVAESYMGEGVSQANAFKIAALEVQAKVPLSSMFEKTDVVDGERPHLGRTGPGQTTIFPMEGSTIPAPFAVGDVERGADVPGITFAGRANPVVDVSSVDIKGEKTVGMPRVRITHVGYDGTIFGSATGKVKLTKTQIPSSKAYLTTSEIETEQAAIALYNNMGLTGRVVSVEEEDGEWVPYVEGDAEDARTVAITLPKDYKNHYVYRAISRQAAGFGAKYEEDRAAYERDKPKDVKFDYSAIKQDNLTTVDKDALEWLKGNEDDPRAKEIYDSLKNK